MSMVKSFALAVAACACAVRGRGDRRRQPRPRQAGQRGRPRTLGHQHRAGRQRSAGRQRHARAGRRRSSRRNANSATARAAQAARTPRSSTRPARRERTMALYVPNATTIFDFTRRAMPWPQPKSLTNEEVYALTAFILAGNKIIGENDVMNARDPAEGEDAQPGRLRQPISGEALNTCRLLEAGGTFRRPFADTRRGLGLRSSPRRRGPIRRVGAIVRTPCHIIEETEYGSPLSRGRRRKRGPFCKKRHRDARIFVYRRIPGCKLDANCWPGHKPKKRQARSVPMSTRTLSRICLCASSALALMLGARAGVRRLGADQAGRDRGRGRRRRRLRSDGADDAGRDPEERPDEAADRGVAQGRRLRRRSADVHEVGLGRRQPRAHRLFADLHAAAVGQAAVQLARPHADFGHRARSVRAVGQHRRCPTRT